MTRDEVGFQLMLTYMVRNIGWSPEVCALKAKEAMTCVTTHFPSVCPGGPSVTAAVINPAPQKVEATITQVQPTKQEPRGVGRKSRHN